MLNCAYRQYTQGTLVVLQNLFEVELQLSVSRYAERTPLPERGTDATNAD